MLLVLHTAACWSRNNLVSKYFSYATTPQKHFSNFNIKRCVLKGSFILALSEVPGSLENPQSGAQQTELINTHYLRNVCKENSERSRALTLHCRVTEQDLNKWVWSVFKPELITAPELLKNFDWPTTAHWHLLHLHSHSDGLQSYVENCK